MGPRQPQGLSGERALVVIRRADCELLTHNFDRLTRRYWQRGNTLLLEDLKKESISLRLHCTREPNDITFSNSGLSFDKSRSDNPMVEFYPGQSNNYQGLIVTFQNILRGSRSDSTHRASDTEVVRQISSTVSRLVTPVPSEDSSFATMAIGILIDQ